MQTQSSKLTSIVGTFVAVALLSLASGCDRPSSDGEVRQLRERLNVEEQRYVTIEKEVVSLREENRRLQAQLAVCTGGTGMDIEERQRLLDDRRAALDHLDAQLDERQTAVQQRELQTERQAREFYEKTNMTMEDIGEARHIKSEYEIMRAEKDAAVAKAEGWLEFIWGVSIALGLSLLLCSVLVYRSLSMHAQHRRETEYRRDVADLLGRSISAQLPPEQALTVVQAFDRLAAVDGSDKKGMPKSLPDST